MKTPAAPLLLLLACGPTTVTTVESGTTPPARASHQEPYPRREAAAAPCAQLLRDGKFEEARLSAAQVLARDDGNPQARAIQAVLRYKDVASQSFLDLMTIAEQIERLGRRGSALNHEYARWALARTAEGLAAVDRDLAVAVEEPRVTLELCPACWRIDWNHDGRVESGDERLLQVEKDADGQTIGEDDPRRKPTFKFDVGDVHWARAAVDFQRALVELVLAYRWNALEQLASRRGPGGAPITIQLDEKRRVGAARALILAGLDEADRARRAYLAETDDDREWVPNPRQQSHAMPLVVDDRLYETWEGVVSDLRHLVIGDEGLEITELAQLGDHRWPDPPRGFLDVGSLLKEPKDINVDITRVVLAARGGSRATTEQALASILGSGYATTMRPSHLITRLSRMRGEIKRDEKELERKLRYLLWLN